MWFQYARSGKQPRGLRPWVLALLRRGPRTGAEIMQDMETVTLGWWRPSPGSVYPLLEDLVSEGLVRRRPDGRYELVPQPRTGPPLGFGFGENVPRTVEEVLKEIQGYVTYLEDLVREDPPAIQKHKDEVERLSSRLRELVP
jgi:hypothetical protein